MHLAEHVARHIFICAGDLVRKEWVFVFDVWRMAKLKSFQTFSFVNLVFFVVLKMTVFLEMHWKCGKNSSESTKHKIVFSYRLNACVHSSCLTMWQFLVFLKLLFQYFITMWCVFVWMCFGWWFQKCHRILFFHFFYFLFRGVFCFVTNAL